MTQIFDWTGRPEVMVLGLGVAIFLSLYWVVRGAPVGQATPREPGEAPSAGYRDRVVALAVLGFVTILIGGFVAAQYGILWSLAPFLLGFGLILRVQAVIAKYRHVSPTLRRTLEFSNTALTCTLLGGVLIVGNVFAFKYGGRSIDFTHDEAFTLSSLSVNNVKGLERPLKFTLVLGRDQGTSRQRDRVRQLVDLYKAENSERITIQELVALNPSQAAEIDALVKRNPDLAVSRGDVIVLEYGDDTSSDRAVIPVADLFRSANPNAAPGESRFSTSFSGEDAITSAIVRSREGKRTRIGFTAGHGEPSIGSLDPRELGLGLWASRLASLGTDAVELNLVKDEIPAEVSLVAVVAPNNRFQEQEVARLKAFLTRGGPMLVVMNGQVKTGLEDLLALHNIAFEPGFILDANLNIGRRADQLLTPPLTANDHPISQALVGQSFLLPKASPIKVIGSTLPKPNEPRPSVNPGIIDYPLLRTGPTSWVETNESRPAFDKGVDPVGPFIVGVAASDRTEVAAGGKSKPKLVVISSPYAASNPILQLDPLNVDLLLNSIQWLRGKQETLGVAPKVHTAIRFTADPNLRAKLHLIPTVVSFVIILGFGVMTYLARRS
jgi:hypothetical protein